ncbi:uncharacterized protein LOC141613879 [Silene latifolia]|uniref:uncharacterized protein LOC141613879 n=1 Tax=Silene latifolia TaxID=37657 RepID=UPI003D76CBC0
MVWLHLSGGDSYSSWKNICKVKESIKNDYVNAVWTDNAQGYSIRRGYDLLRTSQPAKNWASIVGNNWNIPKHSIITWITMNGGLNVKEKLFKFGCCIDDLCCLCNKATETSDHLFLYCEYSCRVRNAVECWTGRALPIVSVLLNGNRKTVQWKVLAVILNVVYYNIRMQRNNARVNELITRPEFVAKQIETEVKRRIKFKAWQNINHLAIGWMRNLEV